MTPSSTVVVVHAHPDDEAIFTGATIRRLACAGVRVVLVTATGGEEGASRVRLRPGESIRQRRHEELERACELLGVQRLVSLGYRDSGAHGGPYVPGSLGAADPREVAARVGSVVEQEAAGTLVHYDPQGIYGHIDHVRVHEVGAWVTRRLGLTGYEATVDGERLRPGHVLRGAADPAIPIGTAGGQISVTVPATTPALLAKMAAMSAHASQIGPEFLDPTAFSEDYGREWFVRRGPAGVIEELLGTAGAPSPLVAT
jgi:LmbE family N-acetylglucosaminyl deacetylase